MCNPMVLTGMSIAIGVGQTIASYVGQAQAAAAQQEYENQLALERNRQIEANNKLAAESYYNQVRLEQLRLQEEAARDSQQALEQTKAARQAKATALVSAGESGISGLSIDRLLADFSRQEALFKDSLAHNFELQQRQSQARIQGYRSEATGRMQSLQPYIPQPIQGPSALGAALQIGGNILSGVSQYQYYKRTGNNPYGTQAS